MSNFNPAAAPERTENHPVVQQNTVAVDSAGYVAGVDIGGTNLRMALADMSGTILARWTSSTVGLREAEKVIGLIHDGLEVMSRQASVPVSSLRSIGVGVPGVTDVDNGIVIATSYLMGWRDVPLREMLEKALNVPALVDNDVNMAAIGESWAGMAKDVQDFVFLAIGTGIGSGIVLNGRPYRGSHWAAGEIGYMLVPGVTGGAGKSSGDPGALESMIGGEGIKEQWQRLWSAETTSLPRDLKATEIFDCALEGHGPAKAILQQCATILAQALYNIALVLNCPLFVLGGSVGLHPALGDETQKILSQWNLRGRPSLVRSNLGSEAQLLGTIRAALETTGVYDTASAK